MAMNHPRTRRGRPHAHRSWSSTRPPSTTDPRRRRKAETRHRQDRPVEAEPSLEGTATTLEAILDDFTESWERGERPKAERYLGLLQLEDSAELIYHEYCLAEASDLAPDPADFLRRFPDQATRLSRLFALHGAIPASALRDWAEPSELPSSGDEIGPYRLLRELGHGAFARVFLAEQADLDDRLVVVKVSTRSTAEPRLLARARHPHIVEVLRHAATDDGALHLVCMPFLGGASLAAVLEIRRNLGRRARSGLDLLADLDAASAPEYPSAELLRPAREILAGLSHAEALAWIVARLAEALDHAYARGVAHGDLKPSNVLMTAEGSPLLLDMNLSTDWREVDGEGASVDLGGTLAYMAPERLAAIARGCEESAPKVADRHRADLYGLGLVLLEALTGEAPKVPRARTKGESARDLADALARSRRILPDPLRGPGDRSIPSALRSILTKCLAPDPIDRYARGNELAEDLDLWRSNRPLEFAEEPRRSILCRQARRRRVPLIGAGLTLTAALIVASIASNLMKGSKRDEALSRYSMIVGRADSGAFGFRRPGQWRDDELSDPAEASARQLARYDVLADPDWRDRDDVRSLPNREREELEVWLLEQILRHSFALRQRPDSPESWRRGLDLLDRTLSRTASPSLQAERSALLGRLKQPNHGVGPAPRASLPQWMDEYLAGVAAEPLHARKALVHYLNALRDRPELFWAHYRAATVAFRIAEYQLATDQLRHCMARFPENPAIHLVLASALCYLDREKPRRDESRLLADALAECNRAVELDPDYARAYEVRAWVRQVSGLAEGLKADIERYAAVTSRSGPGFGLNLDFRLNFQPGPNYARSSDDLQSLARKVLNFDSRDQATRTSLASLIGNARRAEAIVEFDRVLDSDPGHLRARYQRALVIYRTAHSEALAEFSALIEHPRFEELIAEEPAAIRAFHYVATDYLKRGKTAEALEVAQRSLAYVNRCRSLRDEMTHFPLNPERQTSFSPTGETYYLIARIQALDADADRGRIDQVAECLARSFAIDPGFRDGWFMTDKRFDFLRDELSSRLGLSVDR